MPVVGVMSEIGGGASGVVRTISNELLVRSVLCARLPVPRLEGRNLPPQ